MSKRILLPKIMQVGGGAVRSLSRILQSLKYCRPLVITDPTMIQYGYAEQISVDLRENGIEAEIFSDTVPEPTTASIRTGIARLKEGRFDVIVALGGGSVIDSAKAIALLGRCGGNMRDYKFPYDVRERGAPIIAIPTTAGTGSEVTPFTIITDERNDEKMLCVGQGFMPVAAVIDYELTLSLPRRISADTGLDALTHGIEAYVSRKANPFSDQQALAAIRLIAPNLRKVYHCPDNHAAREAMMLGGTLAGIAFANASVALVHGMSRPLGAFFHMPHGMSNALLLPAITEFSLSAAWERYAECARAMGLSDKKDGDRDAGNKLLMELGALNRDLEVPTLSSFGVEQKKYFELIEVMADQALTSGSPANNPKRPSQQEIIELYRKIWR